LLEIKSGVFLKSSDRCCFTARKRTSPGDHGMSVLCHYVRAAAKYRLVDHFVGGNQKRFRYRETERLGSLEVDNKVELIRLLDRNVGGPCNEGSAWTLLGSKGRELG
jgi:hypothetical protein